MNSEESAHHPGADKSAHRSLKWSGLQMRMTMSYVWVTVVLVLLLEILVGIALAFALSSFVAPYVSTLTVRQAAEQYAYAAALKTNGAMLNPHATFLEHQPGTLVLPAKQSTQDDFRVPYIATLSPETSPLAFALLVASDGRVVASSYPRRYPINTPASDLLPKKVHLITNALTGTAASGGGMTAAGSIIYAMETVWSRNALEKE